MSMSCWPNHHLYSSPIQHPWSITESATWIRKKKADPNSKIKAEWEREWLVVTFAFFLSLLHLVYFSLDHPAIFVLNHSTINFLINTDGRTRVIWFNFPFFHLSLNFSFKCVFSIFFWWTFLKHCFNNFLHLLQLCFNCFVECSSMSFQSLSQIFGSLLSLHVSLGWWDFPPWFPLNSNHIFLLF